jgi:hypothetical protein
MGAEAMSIPHAAFWVTETRTTTIKRRRIGDRQYPLAIELA